MKNADQDEWGFHWKDWRADPDFWWGGAVGQLHQFGNPDGITALLAAGAPVPDWVRKELAAWRAGDRPLLPTMNDKDEKLLAAVRAYHDKASRRPRENRAARIERIADEHNISTATLINFLDGKGGTYRRLVRDWRCWDHIYIR